MNFFLENWYLFTLVVLSGGALMVPALRSGAGAGISPQEAVQSINRSKAVVVDVREADEFASGHIAQARNVPLSELETRLPQVVKNKSLPLVLVCATSPRSLRARAVALKLGYENAQALSGGMQAWRSADLPVMKPKS